MTFAPQRALVRPRIAVPGGTLLLEDELLPLINTHAKGTVAILGGPGSGETSALQLKLPGSEFISADFSSAWLTGTSIPNGNFIGACFRNAGLADIDWEGACLREADFDDANFRMGSARSGLVNSPIACEGSKTGFYTDEFHEQHFKNPEQIRKANLRGADLTGAKVFRTDFYLVDLRDATYDESQRAHFERCRAILK